jgi:hypothetical protein
MCGRIQGCAKVQFVNDKEGLLDRIYRMIRMEETSTKLHQRLATRLCWQYPFPHPVDPVNPVHTARGSHHARSRSVSGHVDAASPTWSWPVKPVWLGYPNPGLPCRSLGEGRFAQIRRGPGNCAAESPPAKRKNVNMPTNTAKYRDKICRNAAICRFLPRNAGLLFRKGGAAPAFPLLRRGKSRSVKPGQTSLPTRPLRHRPVFRCGNVVSS